MTDLAVVEERLAALEVRSNRAYWEMATDAANDAKQAAAEAAAVAYELALADPDLHAAGAAVAADTALDELDRRRGEVLRLMTGAKQRPPALVEQIVGLETDLMSRFSAFRATVGGVPVGDNEIDRILVHETDEALRREAWEASKAVGAAVADDLRRLVRLRNEAARARGFRDHYALALAMDEIDEDWLYGLLAELETGLAAAWTAEKAAIDDDVRDRLGLAPGTPLEPWHYADKFFQDAPSPRVDPLLDVAGAIDILPACRAYYADLGHDVDGVIARSDLYPREGKDQHAFAMDVDRAGDVRTLCNITPSLRWLETTLHELGHAVYDESIDRGLPWLVRTIPHIFATEAIAMLHGRRGRDPEFLTRYAGVADAVAHDPLNRAIGRRNLLVMARGVTVMAHFERGMYGDPDQDLCELWWSTVERFQGIARPSVVRPHDWATKIHLTGAPVYYHNYLLGEVLASQLEAALERETGAASPAVHPQAAGTLLRERFQAPGARLRWDVLVQSVTGRPMGADDFIAGLV